MGLESEAGAVHNISGPHQKKMGLPEQEGIPQQVAFELEL
jgi:hypothetical protein